MDFRTGRADLDRVLETVTSSDAFRSAEADRAAKLKADRGVLVARLRSLEKNAERDFPPLFANVAAAEREFAGARRDMNRVGMVIAEEKLVGALRARNTASLAFQSAHDEAEAQLRATAHPQISEFRVELGWLHHVACRKLPASKDIMTVVTSHVTGKLIRQVEHTERLTSAEALEAVLAAQHAAEGLLYEADQEIVPAELVRLRKTLPDALIAVAAATKRYF